MTDLHQQQLDHVTHGKGFFAALDQSGGSTPGALEQYGIKRDSYKSDAEMFDLIQAMRERVFMSPSFSGAKILATILFEKTARSQVAGQDVATYLWEDRRIASFLKVDEGLEQEAHGVQLMKPITHLSSLIELALAQKMLGTKMRSLIVKPSSKGIAEIVRQQFEYGEIISDAGLVPILEPEVSTQLPDAERARAEDILAGEILERLLNQSGDRKVILKLTIPVTPKRYSTLVGQPSVLRVLALSGGFSRDDADERLMKNAPMIASFSRALLQDLRVNMTKEEFDASLSEAADAIFLASTRL